MNRLHMPRVDARYWLAIALASISGTNLGDLYKHNSGIPTWPAVALLALLAGIVFWIGSRDRRPTQLYYWLVIIIIRTGATNIADDIKHRIPHLLFAAILTALLVGLAWRMRDFGKSGEVLNDGERLPTTGSLYWVAMLTAGVFGTLVGDMFQKGIGQDAAAAGLTVAVGFVLAVRGFGAGTVFGYWAMVALARTAGTAVGDWLAENKFCGLGLPLSTLVSTLAFILILVAWRSRQPREAMA